MADTAVAKTKKKRQFKSPNTYVILFCVIVFIAILSWFIPGGAYQMDDHGQAIAGTYHLTDAKPQGFWDVFLAPVVGMLGNKAVSGAIPISLFIMLFGSFLEMMEQTGAVKKFLKRITIKNQNNMRVLIAILVIIMSFFGTVEGAYEEGIVYLLMFLPVILALGLDTVVAVMIVVLGTQIGCLASTVNPFATGIASGIAGISAGDGMGIRFVMLIVMTALVIGIICFYAERIKKDPTKSSQYFRYEEDLKEFPVSESEDDTITSQQKAVLFVFLLTFVIMIISLVPWTSLNSSWTFFDDFAKWIGVTPVLKQVFGGNITPFGSWYFPELSMLLIVMTLVTGKVMKYDINKSIDILIKGAAGLVSTAFVVPLARGIQVVMDAGQITPTILHFGETTLSTLPPVAFVVVSLIFYFLIACLIPSSTGLAAATMAIMASLARFAGVEVSIMVTIYCMALGLAKMVTPTSIVVMTCTQAAHISYSTWLKKVIPIVGILFVASCGFLFISLALS